MGRLLTPAEVKLIGAKAQTSVTLTAMHVVGTQPPQFLPEATGGYQSTQMVATTDAKQVYIFDLPYQFFLAQCTI